VRVDVEGVIEADVTGVGTDELFVPRARGWILGFGLAPACLVFRFGEEEDGVEEDDAPSRYFLNRTSLKLRSVGLVEGSTVIRKSSSEGGRERRRVQVEFRNIGRSISVVDVRLISRARRRILSNLQCSAVLTSSSSF